MPEGANVFEHGQPEAAVGARARFFRGFDLSFENGWTVSVSWGNAGPGLRRDATLEEPSTALLQVAGRDGYQVIWDDAGEPVGKSLDRVGLRESLSPEQVLRVIDEVSTWRSDALRVMTLPGDDPRQK